MKYSVVDPKARSVITVDAETYQEACMAANLEPGAMDHGVLFRDEDGNGMGIWVYEYSLMVPPAEGYYFSIGPALYCGNAVIYGFDGMGETIDIDKPPPIMFYKSHMEVEAAIQRQEIIRPHTSVNGEVFWEWPNKE